MILPLAALAAQAFLQLAHATPSLGAASPHAASTHLEESAEPTATAIDVHVADDTKARWYDLRAIVAAGASTPPGVNMSLHLSSSAIDALEPERWDLDLGKEPQLSLDDCVSAIRAAVDADDDAVIESIEERAGLVRVIGNDVAQEITARAVRAFGSVVTDSVDVEVYRVGDDELPLELSSVLDAEAATSLVDTFQRATAARNAVRIGRATSLGAEDTTAYLYDYDVEVAQGSIAANPVVTTIRTGLDLGVRVDRASDGRRFVVRVWGRDGALIGPMQTIEVDGLGSAPIELPRVATSMWTSSAVVEPGGAIVIDHDGGGASAVVLRIATQETGAGPAEFLPLGELALSPMRPKTPVLSFTEPSGGWSRQSSPFVSQTANWGGDDGVASFIAGALEDPLSNGLALPYGSGLLVPIPERIEESARQAIDELREAAAVATIAVEIRYGFLNAADARAVLAEGGIEAFAQRKLERLLGCGIENDALLLVGGEEFAYLQDHDMEIAAGAAIPDPIVNAAFEGIAVWCAPLRAPEGKVTAWFDVQAHAPVAVTRSIAAVNYRPNRGDGDTNSPVSSGRFIKSLEIQLPMTQRAASRTLVESSDGEWSLVTMRPIAGKDRTLVVAARMTSR